jgi:hypothetical protein
LIIAGIPGSKPTTAMAAVQIINAAIGIISRVYRGKAGSVAKILCVG